MKYLKLYEKFNNSGVEEIKTIKEILLELDDIGYYTSVNYTPLTMTGRHENDEIYVNIISRLQPKAITTSDNYNKNFNKETEEFISRIKDYMKFRGWDFLTDYHDISKGISHQIVFRKKNDNIIESNVSYHNYRRIDTKVAQDIKLTCEEILLELKDEGFVVKVDTEFERFDLNHIKIIISNRKKFHFDYLKEYFHRIERYLEEYNIEFDGFASSIGPVSKLLINPETFETDNSIYVSRFNFKGVKQMKEILERSTDYEEEIPENIQLDLHDILLELKDSGYHINFQWCPVYDFDSYWYEFEKYPYIKIEKWCNAKKRLIKYSDIDEYVERVKEYLDNNEYNTIISINNTDYDITRYKIYNENEDGFEFRIQIVDRNIYGDINESKNTLEDKFDILKELSLPLMDEGLTVNITINPERFHEKGIYVEITDVDKKFCKEWPMNDLDWLVSKPIMKEYYEELNHFGLQYDRDYILYGGGLSATLFFSNKQSKAIKL